MKAALLQLPVQSHDYGYSLENIPLAAGYLKAYAGQNLPGGIEMEICPPHIVSLGGDAAILDWIGNLKPDVVGFSCYLWNIERSLHLCRKIGERLGRVRTVLGGPEITGDSSLLSRGGFDAAIHGEGEETFRDLIAAWARGSSDLSAIPGLIVPQGERLAETFKRGPARDLDSIPSPYLAGAVGPSYMKTIFLETVRGCVHRCSYCSYHKQFRKLRTFDLGRVSAEVDRALHEGVEEISFIDPCFARRPELKSLLSLLEHAQKTRPMRISCELNAEDVSQDTADALVRAGLTHAEIGLQSTNGKALNLSGRRFDEALFTRGVSLLRARGVHVATDIMVGLPGDAIDDVKRSIDFVLQNNLCDSLNLFPVSVLPGTLLKAQASGMGISYQDLPPYYVTKTPWMGPEEMREAFAHAERLTGESYFPIELPRTGNAPSSNDGARIISRLILAGNAPNDAVPAGSIGQALAVEIADPSWRDRKERIRRVLRPILEANPFTLLTWIVPDEYFRHEEDILFLKAIAPRAPHLNDREFMATGHASRSIQLFLRNDLGEAGHALTLVPLEGEVHILNVFLPREAGAREEGRVLRSLEKALGRSFPADFNDMPDIRTSGMDDHLAAFHVKI
ncbi:MAG TPA: radical SAM protein [Deltaproteobacteria bacterium]|nr:radical SAM protein [Deltaproteobacteria bacterium]